MSFMSFFQVGQKVSYEVGYHKEVCTVKEIRKDGLIVVEDENGNQFGTTENRLFIVFNPAE